MPPTFGSTKAAPPPLPFETRPAAAARLTPHTPSRTGSKAACAFFCPSTAQSHPTDGSAARGSVFFYPRAHPKQNNAQKEREPDENWQAPLPPGFPRYPLAHPAGPGQLPRPQARNRTSGVSRLLRRPLLLRVSQVRDHAGAGIHGLLRPLRPTPGLAGLPGRENHCAAGRPPLAAKLRQVSWEARRHKALWEKISRKDPAIMAGTFFALALENFYILCQELYFLVINR